MLPWMQTWKWYQMDIKIWTGVSMCTYECTHPYILVEAVTDISWCKYMWFLCQSTWASGHLTIWPCGHLAFRSGHVTAWPCAHVAISPPGHVHMWSTDYLVFWSSDYLTIWPSDHPIIWASEHLCIWASDHLSRWASGHMAISPYDCLSICLSHYMTTSWYDCCRSMPKCTCPYTLVCPCAQLILHIHTYPLNEQQTALDLYTCFVPSQVLCWSSIKAILCTAMQCCHAMYSLIISTQSMTGGFQSPRCTLSQLRCHVYLYN